MLPGRSALAAHRGDGPIPGRRASWPCWWCAEVAVESGCRKQVRRPVENNGPSKHLAEKIDSGAIGIANGEHQAERAGREVCRLLFSIDRALQLKWFR